MLMQKLLNKTFQLQLKLQKSILLNQSNLITLKLIMTIPLQLLSQNWLTIKVKDS